ncbi:DNA methyltransferase [Streptomyces sp. NBC_00094]|uniref:Eco57I restriction-modification methylase domain-containing protein n=1 Tax=Streptomyces sp. NBC_00094 TaxID=2903620 RepID=UPI00225754A3|nr:DNA methyltransferase [Streptomyces sp. NBC_00094]MCX5393734.1 SAM-dependent DNA methyltransferase [Streptomyces sp. NBC_00094]
MSSTNRNQVFTAVHTVGALLPADMLVRISEAKSSKDLRGLAPSDYRIAGSRSVRDEAERHWDNLKSLWRELREKLPAEPEASVRADSTGYARANWMEPLFEALGFGRLNPVGPDGIVASDGSKTWAVSHRRDNTLVHITAWDTKFDKRQGAGVAAPQSLLQEALNRTDPHIWALLTNGRKVRLLRDSNALATTSYVEFDLEAIFDGELFSEFVLLYRLLHASRFSSPDGAPTQWNCWLEVWRDAAIRLGARFLDDISEGVRQALKELGTGFLKHPANAAAVRDGVQVDAFHGALLRLVYRLLFVFVAEDRDALHPPEATLEARQRYAAYFSTSRLREHSRRRRGTSHTDRYQALSLVLDALGDEAGRPELGLPGLGGLFDATDADAPLRGMSLSNEYLLAAIRHLSVVRDTEAGRLRKVDYRTLDAEELGAIYESLLALVPKYSAENPSFELVVRAGNERKKTGSYYTPSSLVDVLLDSTLDPVIDKAQERGERRAAEARQTGAEAAETIIAELLTLTVCDPACGSGHFLVSAARRIAKRVAAVRHNTPEPTPESVRHALHEVVAKCVYGVDLNPMAVELAKVSLWMEALEPGKALGFLDAHVKLGNGLIGATPALLRGGIPEEAFKAVEGDDAAVARRWQRENKEQHKGVFTLDAEADALVSVTNATFASELRTLVDSSPTEKLGQVRALAERYHRWEQSPEYTNALKIADAWCAAFMWEKTDTAPAPVTQGVFKSLQSTEGEGAGALKETHREIGRLSKEYRFFHWHLEFPEIFNVPEDPAAEGVDPVTGWAGGFSCVLGNPPWDKVDFKDQEYFSVVEPSLAEISGTARRTAIAEWADQHPEEGARYFTDKRKVKSSFLFLGSSGAYPQLRRGLSIKGVNSLQTDQLFTERFVAVTAPEGRCGTVVPTAIATGAGAQFLFQDLTQRGAVKHLYDFENGRRERLFPAVHSSYQFALISLTGRGMTEEAAQFAFFLGHPDELAQGGTVFALSPEEIALINPNTGTLPVFRTRRDADLTAAIHRRFPVLVEEGRRDGNPWNVTFKHLFNLTDDSDLFRDRSALEAEGWQLEGNVFARKEERLQPLYDAKMAHLFDHRWNRYYGLGNDDYERVPVETKEDPYGVAEPRQWIQKSGRIPTMRKGKAITIAGVDLRLKELGWERDWLLGWRDVARTTDERTAIPAFLPRVAVGNSYPLMLPDVPADQAAALASAQSSLVFDFVARQKISGIHMGLMTWKQLPVPHPDDLTPHTAFITPRLLELVYSSWEMEPLAIDLGDTGVPFAWNEDRRTQIRAELDAYFFHLYGVSREDAEYILESFQTENGGLKNNEIGKYGEYRTKRLVLAEYDRMAEAGLTMETPLIDGKNYTSTLTPPPGQGPRHEARPEAG